jgi:hypothetical protein
MNGQFSLRNKDGLRRYTDALCEFIGNPLVRQITGGIHVNDALIYGAWEALPVEWTSWWDSLPDHRLAQQDLIDSIEEHESNNLADNESYLEGRPEALSHWLRQVRSLALPRKQRSGREVLLPDVLKARMNTKKISEISVAVAHVEDVCKARGITHIIDMGSGQGYLSVSLAHLFPDLRILAVDGSEKQVEGSRAFAQTLDIPEGRLRHLVRWIDGTASLASELRQWAKGEKCMLVGLHACGQLSEHMIRYFGELPFISSLAVVGCCFNHIVLLSEACPNGFPISATLREKGVTLSPTAMMTGCQAPNNWQRAEATKVQSSYTKRRFYRTLLEKVFYDKRIVLSTEDRPIWGTKSTDLASFEKYATQMMHNLGITGRIEADELRDYAHRYQDYDRRIAILWTLSVLCCKVVESIIAIDRYSFLVERGIPFVDIVPMFDYKASPRNLVIVGDKSGLQT